MMIKIFTADWCPACKALMKQLDAHPSSPKYTAINLSTPEAVAEARKYSVRSLPAVVLDDRLITKDELLKIINENKG